jgi:hypothetical protein
VSDFLLSRLNRYALLNVGNPKSHLALVLVRLLLGQLANSIPTPQLTMMPTGLPTLISQQASLTHLLRGK